MADVRPNWRTIRRPNLLEAAESERERRRRATAEATDG